MKIDPRSWGASVRGQPTIFGSKKTFDQWKSRQPSDPAGLVGISKSGGESILVFHDPETTRVFVEDGVALFLQVIYAPRFATMKKHMTKLPTEGWKRTKGTFTGRGGEYVLFDGLKFEEENGEPVRVKLEKGDYALEEFGSKGPIRMWKPDKKTEIALARLVLLKA